MTPDEKDLLQKTFALVEENNVVLKKMRSSQRLSGIMRWFYWILIIVLSVASFWLIQPYINSLQGAVNICDTGSTPTTSASGNLNLNQIINDYKQATQ